MTRGLPWLTRSERDALVFHLAFALLAFVVLRLAEPALGLRISVLVVVYNLMLPAYAQWRGHDEWLDLWLFLLPVSLLQVLPDWLLASVFNVLVFPNTGSAHIGGVPVFMAGMWVIPLFMLVMTERALTPRFGRVAGVLGTLLASALIFLSAEALAWRIPIWSAQNVTQWQGVALYLVPALLLLGPVTAAAYAVCLRRALWERLAAAALIMLFYMACCVASYWLVEILWIRGSA
jgi:uncharacterized membrane protein